MKLLHIVATPRERESNTLNVSRAFLETLQSRYSGLEIDTIKLFEYGLPAVAGDNIESKYTLVMGQPIDKHHQESWAQIEVLIKHFLSADIYLISTPMWNFSIPYALKYYIDAIVQPGYLYRYSETGQPIPLTLGKKMLCITSRGGDYAPGGPFHAYDFQEPYLRAIFGYVGIYDMQFINAQPMDVNLELRKVATASAIEKARSLASSYDWDTAASSVAVENPVELKPKPINE